MSLRRRFLAAVLACGASGACAAVGDLARHGWIAIGLPGTYMSTSRTGTGHGTPSYYDRSAPVIFLGAGVEPGRHTELARTVDVAPTLAALADVPMPDDLDGKVLPVLETP